MHAQLENLQSMQLELVPQGLAGHDIPGVVQARREALARFTEHGFPTRREEEWKYTDVSVLGRRGSLVPDNIPPDPPAEAAMYAWALAQENCHLMVFLNGHYSDLLSHLDGLPPEVSLESLADLMEEKGKLSQNLLAPRPEQTVFAELNAALATDGAVLMLPPHAAVDAPIYLLFISCGHGAAIYPRNIIHAAEGSRATIIEHYLGALETHDFTNAVTQMVLERGAELHHYKLLQEGSDAAHIAGIHAELAEHSRYTSHSFALGGHLGRNDITARMTGPCCQCKLNGLYLLDGKEHMDHHTRVDHLAPQGVSREYYRGVLDGEARGVFNGKVVVHPGAILTDAHQSNHNLLLSRKAEVDTKPQLEIYADNVKCMHGATVGQLDADSLFYLRSRGIDPETARTLLVYGFVNDIISQVEVPMLRTHIEQLVLDRLAQGEDIKEML